MKWIIGFDAFSIVKSVVEVFIDNVEAWYRLSEAISLLDMLVNFVYDRLTDLDLLCSIFYIDTYDTTKIHDNACTSELSTSHFGHER